MNVAMMRLPGFTHRLAIALRFHDVFTGAVIRIPLQVSVASLGWQALHASTDATYRFLVTSDPVPDGTHEVTVTATGGEYVSLERLQITLPLLPAPPLRRSDYLLTRPLWPTRRLRLPPGETAVSGHLHSPGGATPVAGLRVQLGPAGSIPPPGAPYTRTDADGAFLFRLPEVRNTVSGTAITPPGDLQIALTGPSGPVAASPASFAPRPGRVLSQRFTVP